MSGKPKKSNESEFKVIKSRKRKMADEKMDTTSILRKRPHFPPHKETESATEKGIRRVPVPSNRYTPLKENWLKIYTPIVEQLKLQIRFNLRSRQVELQSSPETTDIGALQKAVDFVRAFVLGFAVEDALALVRLDELFLESFQVSDVKHLAGDHLSRAIGRIAGSGGRTRYTIENVTKTRIVVANTNIHILGSYQNIRLARTAICNLILGSPPSKVYGNLRNVVSKVASQF